MLYFDFPNWQDKKRILKREIVIPYHIFIHIQWRKKIPCSSTREFKSHKFKNYI